VEVSGSNLVMESVMTHSDFLLQQVWAQQVKCHNYIEVEEVKG